MPAALHRYPRLGLRFAALFILAACSAHRAPSAAVGELTTAMPPGASADTRDAIQGLPADRLLMRRAAIDLEVKEPEAIAVSTRAIAQGLGGYIERSTESSGRAVHVRMRVPTPSLDAAMDAVSKLGRLRSRRLSTDDVTEQIVDLDARATTLRATRERLRALLERTQSIGEIVTVEREIARLQGEIEMLEARLDYLRRRTAFAELDVDAGPKRVLGPLGLIVKGAATLVEKLFVWR